MHQYKIRTFDLVLNFYVMMTFSTYLLEEIEKQKLNELEKKRQEILQLCIEMLKKYFQAIFELGELLPRQVEIIELENCRFADKIIETGLKII